MRMVSWASPAMPTMSMPKSLVRLLTRLLTKIGSSSAMSSRIGSNDLPWIASGIDVSRVLTIDRLSARFEHPKVELRHPWHLVQQGDTQHPDRSNQRGKAIHGDEGRCLG